MTIYPYVYRLDHPITGEFYIGYRSANIVSAQNDLGVRYFTSSKLVKDRFSEFKYEIIAEFFDATAAYDHEQLLINESWGKPGLLNKSCYHGKKRLYSHDEETRKKISRPGKSNPNYGNKWTYEMKAALSAKKKGIPSGRKGVKLGPTGKPSWNSGMSMTDEYKRNMSESCRGIPKSEDWRQKMRQPKNRVCRISDRKEMSVNHFNRN